MPRPSPRIAADALGLGLRVPHYAALWSRPTPGVDFFEVISENFLGPSAPARANLRRAAERAPVVLHGVGLNLLGSDPLDRDYLRALRRLADEVDAPWVTDHLCWTSAHGRLSHDLLPAPMNAATARYAAERARIVQDILERPFGLENLSSVVALRDDPLGEAEFYAEVVGRAGVWFMLDVNNIVVSARNHGLDPHAYLDAIDGDRILQVHVAGHRVLPTGPVVDTHDEPVPDEVWALYARAWSQLGPFPTLLEWDDKIPAYDLCVAEVGKARHHQAPTTPRAARASAARPAPEEPDPPSALRPAPEEPAPPSVLGVWQAALLDVVTQPLVWCPPRAAAAADAYPARVVDEVRSDARASARDRLTAYHEQVWFRWLTVLQGAYPTLSRLMGLWSFNQLASAYLAASPPRSVDLGELGADLPAYLVASPWDEPLRREAAAYDRAWTELFHLPPTAAWAPSADDASRLFACRLVPSPTLRRLTCHWPVPLLRVAALEHDSEAPLAAPAPDPATWVLCRDPHLDLIRARLDPALARLLTELDHRPLGEALASTEAAFGATVPDLHARVRDWLQQGMRWGWWSGLAEP